MARKRVPIDIPAVDELFTSQSERDSGLRDGITNIPLALIDPFPSHPFHVKDDPETGEDRDITPEERERVIKRFGSRESIASGDLEALRVHLSARRR